MAELQEMMSKLYHEELIKAVEKLEEELTPKPGWQGFTGIQSIFDEWEVLPPEIPSWTPKEFEVMWARRSHVQKIVFVLDLIT